MTATKGAAKTIAAVERQRRALELRTAGMTLERIAQSLGYQGPSGARQAIASALKRTIAEPADALRVLEAIRLDRLQAAVWTKALGGDLPAVDRVLKIMERRARLLGLDAPQTVNVSHEMTDAAARVAADLGLDPADVIAEAERIVASLGTND